MTDDTFPRHALPPTMLTQAEAMTAAGLGPIGVTAAALLMSLHDQLGCSVMRPEGPLLSPAAERISADALALAGVLHLCIPPAERPAEVSVETMNKAIALTTFYAFNLPPP